MMALIQHQAIHAFKLPVLNLSFPQCRNQYSILGPAEENVFGGERNRGSEIWLEIAELCLHAFKKIKLKYHRFILDPVTSFLLLDGFSWAHKTV